MEKRHEIPCPTRPPWRNPVEMMWLFAGGALLGLTLCLAAAWGAGVHLDLINTSWPPWRQVAAAWKIGWWAIFALVEPGKYAQKYAQIYANTGGNVSGWFAVAGLGVISAISLSALSMAWFCSTPPENPVHVRGRKISTAPADAQKSLNGSRKRSGVGLPVHPDVEMSQDLESKHMMIVGATGEGKTTILSPLICEAIRRNDKCLIFDPKPDFTEWIPGHAVILAPWDERGAAWNMGADVLDKGDAETLAMRFIPGQEVPWDPGARIILEAAIIECQQTKGQKWGPIDIIKILIDDDEIMRTVKEHKPLGSRVVAEMASKTTQSLLITLSAQLGQFENLAEWSHGKPKFSFRRWLLGQAGEGTWGTVIMAANDRYRSLSSTYCQSIVSICTSIICSPDFRKKEKVWLFLDELPQLGKMPELSQLLAVGRSKGCRVVMGTQDISQIRDIYGVHQAQAWASMFGTWIIVRIKGTESPKWFSELLGEREIWRWSPGAQRDVTSGAATSVSESWRREREPVIFPDEFTDLIGAGDDGIDGIFYVPGNDTVYLLHWDFFTPEKVRENHIQHTPARIREILNGGGVAPPAAAQEKAAPGGNQEIEPEASEPEAQEVPEAEVEPEKIEAGDPDPETFFPPEIDEIENSDDESDENHDNQNQSADALADVGSEIAGGTFDAIVDPMSAAVSAIEIVENIAGSGSHKANTPSLAEDVAGLLVGGEIEEQETEKC